MDEVQGLFQGWMKFKDFSRTHRLKIQGLFKTVRTLPLLNLLSLHVFKNRLELIESTVLGGRGVKTSRLPYLCVPLSPDLLPSSAAG